MGYIIGIINQSKPPALPGDSQSLTIPGVIVYYLIRESPKVQCDEEKYDDYTTEFKAYEVGM